ncbi:MAG: hypothetical protein Q7U94_06400 [Sideroxyarcus sp.]|nr:hypothetical protein [Sideroxyarcus sp.]
MKFHRLNRYRTGGTSSNLKLSYPAPRTPNGRVYRFSPNEQAHPRHFVLGDVVADINVTDAFRARMKHDPRTTQTVCPYSGTIAEDDAFVHPDDVKAAVEMVRHDAVQDVQDALSEMFKNAFKGSSSNNSLIKVTASVKRSIPKPKPRFARQDLMRELVCDHCGRDYGVFAISLFCPDCGAPNLRLHFVREAELVDDQVSLAEEIAVDKEELAYRLLGNAHEDVLTAFEATLKTVYLHGKSITSISPLPKVGNDFQNVEKALKRFEELRLNPFNSLTEDEMEELRLNIQKRHVIGHNLGVVDDKFAAHDNDAKVGETVILVGDDIRKFAAISQKVIDNLDTWLGGSPSPTIQAPLLSMNIEPKSTFADPKNLMALDLQLSLFARKVGVWIAEHCSDGRCTHVNLEQFKAAFTENSEIELEEAIAELEIDGFVEMAHTMGGGIPHFCPTLDLYLTFDGPAFGRDPIADTVTVAELALAGSDSVNAEDIFSQTGWDIRRFNPVFEHVASQIPDGRVSRSYGTQFSVSFFCLLPEDRVRVKRLISRLKS